MPAVENLAAATIDIQGLRVLVLDASGPVIVGERDAPDYIGECFSNQTRMVVLPVTRLTPDFFTLRTRVAGDVIQKFINYDIRVTILGDIRAYIEQSDALRDFVRESNRGDWVWFLEDQAELERRLAEAAQGLGL